ncbi:MAG: FtsX-like permease family protein [Pseudonocardiaceae bacterium]
MLLGVFLALLAVGAVGHALGMTRRQCRGVVFTQASVLAAVGLLFGVPLGIALGRTVWRLIAENTPLLCQASAVAFALLLVLANLLAALPSPRAVRLPVNQILRAE